MQETVNAFQDGSNPVLTSLKRRWEETNPESTERTLWDVALILAYQQPALTKSQNVLTPPENRQRLLNVYTQLDTEKMKQYYLEKRR